MPELGVLAPPPPAPPAADPLFRPAAGPVAAPQPPAAPPAGGLGAQLPPGARAFDDVQAARKAVFERAKQAVSGLEPAANQRHVLAVEAVDYDGPERISLAEQKRAVLRGQTLARRLRGDLVLRDAATGDELDRRRTTLTRVPYLTERGTFILEGVEYTLASQMRLRPGVFTRVQSTGEVEAHVNSLPGQGFSHRLRLDPAKSVFRVQVAGSQVPLFPVLKALGATDDDIRRELGDAFYAAGAKEDDPAPLKKLYRKLVLSADLPDDAPPEKFRETVRKEFERVRFDPEVTRRTLGEGFDRLGPKVLLAAAKKLVAVNRGEAGPDDRDAMAFQHLLGPEDLLAERLGASGKLLRGLLWKASAKGDLSPAAARLLEPQVQAVFRSSGLANSLEEVNPLEMLDQLTRVSRLGYGAIGSADAVPDESRVLQPTHAGFIDPLRTPESGAAGVDLRLATSARKGPDGQLLAPFRGPDGKLVWKTPQETADLAIAFPGELERGDSHVAAVAGGRLDYVPREQALLAIPQMEDAFNHLSNLVPGKSGAKGQRALMGGRFLTQALPLQEPEAPLVQAAVPWANSRSYDEEYGSRAGAVFAPAAGTVVAVTPEGVTVRGDDGKEETHELYNWFPLNRKTGLHNEPAVQVGQRVRRGDLLARSNFTDGKGAVAVGRNLRVAYLPDGKNFEDAYTISESAAKKLTSQHLYQNEMRWEDGLKRGKAAFATLFPSEYKRAQLDRLDDDGVVKVGQVVGEGDPLIVAARKAEFAHNRLSRSAKASYRPEAVTWDHADEGLVTDVERTDRGVAVTVRALRPMQEADKLAGRYGDKGVVRIVPDDEMPVDSQGRPFEVLANPLGVITRENPVQAVEAALGKLARATGKPVKVRDFGDIQDLAAWAQGELAKHGLEDKEDVFDPKTGQTVRALTGERYFLKLHHMAEDKDQGRATGGYSSDDTPSKGGASGSKRLSMLETSALLSHGAYGVLRDKAVRGQKNLDYWAAFMAGQTPPEPKVPYVWKKFVADLTGSGVRVVPDGPRLKVMALTDRDVSELAGDRELRSAETVDWKKQLEPVKGGLFDPALTGGHGGSRWSFYTLPEPMPNPLFEEPIRRLLGYTEKEYRAVLAGRQKTAHGTGPAALAKALEGLDLGRELAQARYQVEHSRGATRDAAVRRLAYLKGSEATGVHPKDWVLSRVPVLPPIFRPVSVMANTGSPVVADANLLYKDLFEAGKNYRALAGRVDDVGDERLAVYDAFKAVTGLGEAVNPKNAQKNVQGLLREVFGDKPKFSWLQRKLLSSTVDLVGRGVVTPDSDLDMDTIGLPERKAWDVYRPFVVRRLTRRGVPPVVALKMFDDRAPLAKEMLLAEMDARPVLVSRAPVWHRYGILAFRPRLVRGDSVKVSPLIVKGFNMDFDGDMANYHVPASEDAVRDATERMLPSRNLFSVRDFRAHQAPANEFLGGLYEATARKGSGPERVFRTTADVTRALARGEIRPESRVVVLEDGQ